MKEDLTTCASRKQASPSLAWIVCMCYNSRDGGTSSPAGMRKLVLQEWVSKEKTANTTCYYAVLMSCR